MKAGDKMEKPVDTRVGNKSKSGGPTSLDRKKFGRNMSRVKNQRGG